jgi:branched-chain amino acid transport system ATP-binding protein
MVSLLEVSGLSVRYGGIAAVNDVSFTVRQEQVLVILGSNGAGKTSTLRAVMSLERKAAGSVRFRDIDITKWRPHRTARAGLTLVPEGRRIFAPLTVEENLLLGAFTKSRLQARSEMDRVYSLFPVLHERRSGRAGLLSGGEQQMLAFGRALMSGPELIMMDEPSMGLAPSTVELVMQKVGEIAATGVGILMVEQNAAAAFEVSTDAIVLERGEIVLTGTTTELSTSPLVVKAFLGDKAMDDHPADAAAEVER